MPSIARDNAVVWLLGEPGRARTVLQFSLESPYWGWLQSDGAGCLLAASDNFAERFCTDAPMVPGVAIADLLDMHSAASTSNWDTVETSTMLGGLRNRDGTSRPVEVCALPGPKGGGTLLLVRPARSIDRTPNRAVAKGDDAMARPVSQRHRELFDALEKPLLVALPGGEIVDANLGAEMLLGFDQCEVRTLCCRDVIGESAWTSLQSEVCAPGRTHSARREGIVVRRHGNSPIKLDIVATKLELEQRIVVLMALNSADRARSADAAAHESAELLRQLALNLREVFWVSDASFSEILYVSPAFESMWEMPRSRIYANPLVWRDAVLEEDLPEVDRQLAIQAQGKAAGAEFRIRRGDGSVRWIWGRSFPWFDAEGHPRVAGIVEDVTERRHAEEARLERGERQREALVREIHHRMKNSLQGVSGLLERFARHYPALADAVHEASTQVRSIAMIHALQGKASDGRILLCELVPMIAGNLEELFDATVRIRVENRRQCVALLADREAVPLAIALNELLTNAVKHQPASSGMPAVVEILLSGDHAHAEVRIVNPGRLPSGFDFAAGQCVGEGLDLVRALLPPCGATLQIEQRGDHVESVLGLFPPAISTDPTIAPRRKDDH